MPPTEVTNKITVLENSVKRTPIRSPRSIGKLRIRVGASIDLILVRRKQNL